MEKVGYQPDECFHKRYLIESFRWLASAIFLSYLSMKKNFIRYPMQVFSTTSLPYTKLVRIHHQALIQSCLSGKRSSQNELYHLFAHRMFNVCLRYGKDRNEAEEILQERFIKVFASLHQYRSEGSLEVWIRRVMVTTALQHLCRQSSLYTVLSFNNNEAVELPEQETIESSLNEKELLKLVQSLPSAYRVVFNLYVFEGYQHKEIAGLLRISEGTFKSNLHDARQWLKERIMATKSMNQFKKKCL